MATNDFVTFATQAGSNVMPQAAYLALAARLTGYQSGLAQSVQMNKTWRQSSIIASMIAQFISDVLNVNVVDDGTLATIEQNFELAILQLVNDRHYCIDISNAANYLYVNLTGVTYYRSGMVLYVRVANNNTGASYINVNGLGNVNIVTMLGAQLVGLQMTNGGVYTLIYDGSRFQLLNVNMLVGGVLTGSLPNPGLAPTGTPTGYFPLCSLTVLSDGRIYNISALGWTPVQQGTGISQGNNAVKLGWDGAGLRCTIDSSDQGDIAFQWWVYNTFVQLSQINWNGIPGITWMTRSDGMIEQEWESAIGPTGNAPFVSQQYIGFPRGFPHTCLNVSISFSGNNPPPDGNISVQRVDQYSCLVSICCSFNSTFGIAIRAKGY